VLAAWERDAIPAFLQFPVLVYFLMVHLPSGVFYAERLRFEELTLVPCGAGSSESAPFLHSIG
jgi:hypothetical protein